MPLLHLLLLAIIQGVTEFLPVSSSGHLILLPALTGMQDQGQALDVAVHVGTLGAVILYFWTDARKALIGLFHLPMGRKTDEAKLALLLILATIPVVIFGVVLKLAGVTEAMRSITVIGWTMVLFGIVLYWADQKGPTVKSDDQWSVKDAVIMGLWQAIALIPGTSRSGATITGARFLGYTREDGTKLAMLMSIPTIIASGTLLGLEVAADANAELARDGAIAAAFAFVSALLALSLMMRMLRSVSFTPYVIYRIILGVILLGIAYT